MPYSNIFWRHVVVVDVAHVLQTLNTYVCGSFFTKKKRKGKKKTRNVVAVYDLHVLPAVDRCLSALSL